MATGISSVAAQLLIVRECLSQFQGNEFVIALTLFNWLVFGGVGTILARWSARHFRPTGTTRLGWISLILAAFPVFQIFAIRLLRDVIFVHGVSVGFYQTFGFTFLSMAPYALLVGFALPYSLFVMKEAYEGFSGTRIYILDNIGDVTGGALFAFVIVYLTTPLQGILLASFALACCSVFLFPRPRRVHPGFTLGLIPALAILIAGVVLERASLDPAEGELAYYSESRYGRITVHRDREQYTLFEDGVPVYSTQNLVMAEETVHYPLAQVAKPETVLIVSAQSGMTDELEKYRLKKLDYVELNPESAAVQFRFGMINHIKGMNVIHRDGRAFLSDTDTLYDAIIVNLPEPNTFRTNRFFTTGFFALAKKRLIPGGVLSFSVQGFENYLSEPQRQKISSLFNTVKTLFDHILLLPGQRIFFLCGDRELTVHIPGALEKKGISTQYISSYFDGNLTNERIKQLNGLIDPATPLNLDQSPRLMRIMFTQWFAKFSTSPRVFIIAVTVLCLVYLARIAREEFVLFSTGFTTMGSEILVIFAFQIFFGYIYLQIGLIVTVFLAGLMPGAWIGSRLARPGRTVLVFTDLMLMMMLVAYIVGAVRFGEHLPPIAFLAFGFTVSLLCGCQFPVALELRGDDHAAAAGAFSADLMGAAFGTLITSVVLLPYAGLTGAAMLLIVLKMVSLAVVGRSLNR